MRICNATTIPRAFLLDMEDDKSYLWLSEETVFEYKDYRDQYVQVDDEDLLEDLADLVSEYIEEIIKPSEEQAAETQRLTIRSSVIRELIAQEYAKEA